MNIQRKTVPVGFVLVCVLYVTIPGCGRGGNAQHRTVRIPDTIGASIVAAFTQTGGLTVLTGGEHPWKISYLDDGGVVRDSLLMEEKWRLRSRSFDIVYQVDSSTVTELYVRRIVHPSSNWQGQTPGVDTVVNVYERVDR